MDDMTHMRRMRKDLISRLETSDESKRKLKKCRNLLRTLTFKQSKESFAFEGFEGIPAEKIDEYVESMARAYKFPDEVKDYTLDAMKNGHGRKGSINDMKFENGIITILLFDCIVKTRNGNKDLVFSMYNWSFELAETIKSTYYLFGFIQVRVKTTNSGEITMNEDQKNLIRAWSQEKLLDYTAPKGKERKEKKAT